jgi:hypothetical protein
MGVLLSSWLGFSAAAVCDHHVERKDQINPFVLCWTVLSGAEVRDRKIKGRSRSRPSQPAS